MEHDPKFQTTRDYLELLKRILTHRSIIGWIILSIILLSIAFIADIPLLSIFVDLSPMVGLSFLLIILVILAFPANRETKIGIPGLTVGPLSIILLIAISGITFGLQAPSIYVSNLIQFVFMFIIPFLLVWFALKADAVNLGFSIGKRENMYWTLIVGILYGLLVWFLIGAPNLIAAISTVLPPDWMLYIPSALFIAIVLLLFAVALPEEFVFRALVQPVMIKRFGRLNGVLLSSLIFGLAHLPVNYFIYLMIYPIWLDALIGSLLMSILFQAQIGLVLGVAYEWTRSLVMPVTLHAIHDLIEMFPYFVYLVLPHLVVLVL